MEKRRSWITDTEILEELQEFREDYNAQSSTYADPADLRMTRDVRRFMENREYIETNGIGYQLSMTGRLLIDGHSRSRGRTGRR